MATALFTGSLWGGLSNSDQCVVDLLSIPERHSPLAEYARKAVEAEAPDSKIWAKIQSNLKSGSWAAQQGTGRGISMGGGGSTRSSSGDAWRREDAASQKKMAMLMKEKLHSDEAESRGRDIGGMSMDETPKPKPPVNAEGKTNFNTSYEETVDAIGQNFEGDVESSGNGTFFGFGKTNRDSNGQFMDSQTDDRAYLDSSSSFQDTRYSHSTTLQDRRQDFRVDEKYDRMMEGHDEYEPVPRSEAPKPTTWDEIRRRRREGRR